MNVSKSGYSSVWKSEIKLCGQIIQYAFWSHAFWLHLFLSGCYRFAKRHVRRNVDLIVLLSY